MGHSRHSRHSRKRKKPKNRVKSFIILILAVVLLFAAAYLVDHYQGKRTAESASVNSGSLAAKNNNEITNGVRRYRRRSSVKSVLLVSTADDVTKDKRMDSKAENLRLLVTDKDKKTWQIVQLKMETMPVCEDAVSAVNDMLGCSVVDHYAVFDEGTLSSIAEADTADLLKSYQQIQSDITTDMNGAQLLKLANDMRGYQRSESLTVDEQDKEDGYIDQTILDTFYQPVS